MCLESGKVYVCISNNTVYGGGGGAEILWQRKEWNFDIYIFFKQKFVKIQKILTFVIYDLQSFYKYIIFLHYFYLSAYFILLIILPDSLSFFYCCQDITHFWLEMSWKKNVSYICKFLTITLINPLKYSQ